MAENCSCSPVPVTIKLEPSHISPSCESASCTTSTNISQCTCGLDKSSKKTVTSDSKCMVSSSRESGDSRDVLVNFGLNRKKIMTLRNEEDDLQTLFSAYMQQEPAFSKLLNDSYVVFQEFNSKFETWVDVEECKNLNDGAVVKAVFFPKMIEREDSDPSSVKQTKRKNSVKQTNEQNMKSINEIKDQNIKSVNQRKVKQEKVVLKTVYEEKKVIEINLSSDSDHGNKADEKVATTKKAKKSKLKKTKRKEKTISDDDSSCHISEPERSKKKKKKRCISAEEESNTSAKSGDDVGKYPNIERASNFNENVSAPKLHPQRSSVSTDSSFHLRQGHQKSFNGNLHWKRKDNFMSTTTLPSLLGDPPSRLVDALSRNKSFDDERSRYRQTHNYKNNEKLYNPNDAENILKKRLIDESATQPIYMLQAQFNGGVECRLSVKGKTFTGNGRTQMAARTEASISALEYFYPEVRFRHGATSTGAYNQRRGYNNRSYC